MPHYTSTADVHAGVRQHNATANVSRRHQAEDERCGFVIITLLAK